MKVNFSPASRSCFTRSAAKVSIVSSMPWPARAVPVCKIPNRSSGRKNLRSIFRPLLILHGDVFVVRRPFHGAFDAGGVAHDPEAAAGIGRAGEHQAVFVHE